MTSLVRCHLYRQDAEARGIVIGHDVSDGREVDLQWIDVEILEADMPGKPFGQRILMQNLVRRQQRFPILSGNDRQWVNVLALTTPFGNHRIGASLADHAIGNQHAQKLRQSQFMFMLAHLLHV